MKRYPIVWITCLLLLSGCKTWVPVGGEFTSSAHNYTVELPQGWKRLNVIYHQTIKDKNAVIITRKGPALAYISISRVSTDEALPHAKRRFSKGMLPEEAADLIIQDMRSNPQLMNQRIVENMPARLSGRNGFKIVYTYRTQGGLKKKGIICGLLMDPWCYQLKYEAAQRHYFARNLATFARVKGSFRLLKMPY
jgi:hypothetical protein